MPVPSSISDLSATPSLNSPAGTESPSTVDDYLRTQAAFIRQVDDKATGTVKAADLAAPSGSALVGHTPVGTLTSTTVGGAINEIVSDLAATGGAALVGYGASTVQATLQSHDSALANVEGNLNFTTLPTATTPVADADLMLIRQGAFNKKLPVSVIRSEFAADAEIAEASAIAAKDQAVTAKTAAEAARDVAFINANVYADIATGRAAVADGQQFSVASGDEIVRYRRDSSTTQTEVARFPSKGFVDGLTLFPGRANWVAEESSSMSRILSLSLYGANPAKFYFVKYLWWKDVGTRFNLTISVADDAIGTGAVDAASYALGSGSDTWNTAREIDLAAVGGSGLTGTAIIDFTSATAMTLNTAPSTAAMYQRRRISQDVAQLGAARRADIGVQAEAAIPVRKLPGLFSLHLIGGNGTHTGQANTSMGYNAMTAITTGSYNTAFGRAALQAIQSGNYSSAFGNEALASATGSSNNAFGWQAGKNITTGTDNVLFGQWAGLAIVNGVGNVAVGNGALRYTTGSYSTAIGHQALFNSTALGNTAVGDGAAFGATTASNLTAIGRRAAYAKTTGADCVYVGVNAGYSGEATNTGEGVTAIGTYSFGHSTTGSYNTGCGRASGWYGTSGSNNSYLGYRCGYGNTIGSNNVAAGFYAGHNTSTGSGNTFLGALADSFVPSSAMTATAASGSGLSVGAYSYRVSFVLDGVETGLSEPPANAATTTGNQQVDLTNIPTYTGPKTCSARKIYRTPMGGEHLLYLVATIADNTTTTYSDTTPDGSLGAQPTGISGSIAIGLSARVFKSNQMVAGSTNARITECFVGGGVEDTSPETVTHSSSNASGANVAGGGYRIRGGLSTGSARGGSVILAASPPGTTGSSPNAAVDWVELDGRGFLNIKETSSPSVPTPAAGSVNLFVEGGALKFRDSSGAVKTLTSS